MSRDATVEHMLETKGPCLSSAICKALQHSGLSPAAARQRVARARGAVKRLRGLEFPHKVQFLYHEDSFRSDRYWEALVRDLGEASPAYAAAIGALKARGGIAPERHWPIISGSPVRQQKQISSASVLQRFLAVNLVECVDVQGIGPTIAFSADGFFGSANHDLVKARLVVEQILLLAIRDWSRKLGLVSFNKINIRDEGQVFPKVGNFNYDLAAPSYIRSIVRRNKEGTLLPGFLVCDVILGSSVNDLAIKSFLRKCDLTAQMRNIAPLFPMLVADHFSKDALSSGRSAGIILATPLSLFGEEVAAGLAALLQTLNNAAAVAVKNPELVGDLFKKLGQIEGAAANLRGALFEVIVAHCVMKIDSGNIDIGKKILDTQTGQRAEIDIFRIKEYIEAYCYECKAHQPDHIVSYDEIKKWIEKKVPVIFNALSREPRFQGVKFFFEFWTCGAFSPEAENLLRDCAEKTKKYSVGWKDGNAVRNYASKVRPKSIVEMLDQHFFKHPLK